MYFNYTYDTAGNIINITLNDEVMYEYSYDPHGRMTKEKDYTDGKYYEYDYNETGSIQGKSTYELDSEGSVVKSSKKTVKSEYTNEQWPDQMTSYDGNTITYDGLGNPLQYYNGLSFTWDRGRQLAEVRYGDDRKAVYRYNENGLRIYKETADTTTAYEWDGTKLIRETVTYKATEKAYDVWYFYDSNDSVIGFEYSQISEMDNSLKKTRVYYEKNLQGDVIGLLDARGAEIATYAYDAWGNITDTVCYEGNETAYALNHITYRSYYRDEETGFYYLQSRYYDTNICRFVNADDTEIIGINEGSIFKDNLYVYCNNNPIKYIDPSGYWVVSAGIELGAAFVLGLYVMVGVNYDGTNLSVTLAFGVLCITNASAYISGYLAYYPKKKNVNSLNGIGLSTGASFSVGIHLSGSGAAELSQNGNGFSASVGYGASFAPIPYWQVKGGWTWTIVKWKLSSIKNGTSVTKSHIGAKVKVTKYSQYTNIYIYAMKKTIRVYNNKNIRIY